ncbi:hypothetical protein IEQ34_026627 [Dendrobium chrysotoxum]|uniref:Bifunctional inhibitor/plant lipid transfer protein/seed storage helical domain-containing protein n=1 Tax=Dendrobium chrysotoxum TaxID=161865 RepID=A0AAV7FLP9_DENCH|nr:hypothetical protein IEQ34_026627 [Dendrobium chrysotoxum]
MDFFAVSLFDGYNRPMLVCPTPSTASPGGNCTATGSLVDLNGLCSSNLKVILSDSGGQSVACKSACDAFGKPEFCCIRLLEFVYSGISGRVILRTINSEPCGISGLDPCLYGLVKLCEVGNPLLRLHILLRSLSVWLSPVSLHADGSSGSCLRLVVVINVSWTSLSQIVDFVAVDAELLVVNFLWMLSFWLLSWECLFDTVLASCGFVV